jgi:hypothetical protein
LFAAQDLRTAAGRGPERFPAGHRWDSSSKIRFAQDSPLEGSGFLGPPLWQVCPQDRPNGPSAPSARAETHGEGPRVRIPPAPAASLVIPQPHQVLLRRMETPRGRLDRASLCQAVREAAEERHGRCRSNLRSGAAAVEGAPPRATAICRDGTYSFSEHPYASGTCSHHGGVDKHLP